MDLGELVTKDFLVRQLAEERTATDKRFEQMNVKFAEIRGDFRTLYWIISIVVAATVLPQLQRLFSL